MEPNRIVPMEQNDSSEIHPDTNLDEYGPRKRYTPVFRGRKAVPEETFQNTRTKRNQHLDTTEEEGETNLMTSMLRSKAKDIDNEIFVMASAQELRTLFMKEEEHFILWCDPNLNSEENLEYVNEVTKLFQLRAFTDINTLCSFLSSNKTTCQIIISGKNEEALAKYGEAITKYTASIVQVYKIYLFCSDSNYHKSWTASYSKITCIETVFDLLLKKLKNRFEQWRKKKSSIRGDLPVFAPIFDDSDKSRQDYLHLLLRGFRHFQDRKQAKMDFITLVKEIAYKKQDKMDIETFENEYNEFKMESVLNWYTKECFFYKITNNCLRVATPDTILYCRLALRDIECAIKEKYQLNSHKFKGILYRGTRISDTEWNLLQQNVGKDIEMYGFLSASKCKDSAKSFCQGLFITIIVPGAVELEEQGFAEMEEYTDMKGEEEVLFNVRSRFRILETSVIEINGDNCYHLVLLYGSNTMRRFLTLYDPSIEVKVCTSLNICHLCKSQIQICNKRSLSKLYFINLANHQEYLCANCLSEYADKGQTPLLCISSSHIPKNNANTMLSISGFLTQYEENPEKPPFYGYKCSCFVSSQSEMDQHSKEAKYWYKCLTCQSKKLFCNACFSFSTDCLKSGHLVVLEVRPFTFWSDKMSQEEIKHYEYQEQLLDGKTSSLQGDIFKHTHNYEKMIQYYKKHLQSNDKLNPEKKAKALYRLGLVHTSLSEHEKAIEVHLESLRIRESIFDHIHSQIADSYSALGEIYTHKLFDGGFFGVDAGIKAVEYLSKSLEIRTQLFGENDPSVADSMCALGLAYAIEEEHEKALQLEFESLEIRIIIFGDIHPTIAASHRAIGLVYRELGDLKKALEHYFQCLAILKTLFGGIHPQVARSCAGIAIAYNELGKFSEALDFARKSLKIRKSVMGEKDYHTSMAYTIVGIVLAKLKMLDKGLENMLKALEIRKQIFGENHESIAYVYHHMANMYCDHKKYDKALEARLKALEIRKSIVGDEVHILIAQEYKDIGEICQLSKQHLAATTHFTKAYEIIKTLYGPEDVRTTNASALVYKSFLSDITLCNIF